MTPSPARPRSLSGGELRGDRLVRFVYLDEAGISANEPFAVVAGIVVHADQQWKALERQLHEIAIDSIGEDKQDGFVFHAIELYSGGKFFDRETWPKETRWIILERVLSIPRTFSVPLVMGYIKKQEGAHPRTQAIRSHALAFAQCAVAAEEFMRRGADKEEVALITVEDNSQMRTVLRIMHDDLRSNESGLTFRECGPISRIVDTVHFAAKHEASLLQIADACAFVLQRHLKQASHNDHFLQALFGSSLPVWLGDMLRYPGGAYACHLQPVSLFCPVDR